MFSAVQLIMVSGQCPSYLIITRRDPGIDKTCPEEKETMFCHWAILCCYYELLTFSLQFSSAFQPVAELEVPKLWDWN